MRELEGRKQSTQATGSARDACAIRMTTNMRHMSQRPGRSSLSRCAFLQTFKESRGKAQVEPMMIYLLCNGNHRNKQARRKISHTQACLSRIAPPCAVSLVCAIMGDIPLRHRTMMISSSTGFKVLARRRLRHSR